MFMVEIARVLRVVDLSWRLLYVITAPPGELDLVNGEVKGEKE